ncbi:MAG: amino acid ABC transporter permease [Roseibium album]|uniref:Glutamate/aspartate import permease protein GltK n=1 Tax=Roseibium album TaxID=311410 RepID=A0A0M6Z7G7_9HYPH|nr:amino acid ABC transporter permease [Roseibium album]MBG6159452.1 polar amino acid transport system permease protein [Labrenzia sp. EL_162]MBG6175891.1 polar amino acid transport system permease protein [Labrenzia sp. EL_132]MBG6198150.1 polar amino acid transport system permease protein [Labrenzia sp. EL_159]MBG6204407.1 polar amino acid transport system permease protein [Labrenzia sp. EL_13]MBG6230348.1 polar amino acid transport system permease protein [Labrenzia sp. EL_208]MCR9057285.1
MYEWDFSPVLAEGGFLLVGFRNTLVLTATALSGGLVVGLLLAFARLSHRRWLKVPAGIVIEVFRTTPPLVQLFWFYFGLPIVLSIEMTPFLAASLTFMIQSGAFFAEIFRAGIVSIERGQWEAANAIGMTYNQCMRRVILPQAVKRMFPSMMERSIELMKTTTLVATVSYADLLFQANELAQKTFRPLEVFTVVALIYFVSISFISFIASRMERRFAKSGEFTP